MKSKLHIQVESDGIFFSGCVLSLLLLQYHNDPKFSDRFGQTMQTPRGAV